MAKGKSRKSGTGIRHKHLHSRISYLNQAATYLATKDYVSADPNSNRKGDKSPKQASVRESTNQWPSTQPRHLLSQLRAVSLKSQIKLSRELKHSLCKRCDSLLVPGQTSIERTSNDSSGGRKPWADVLVVTCKFCGTMKRFPVGRGPRQPKRSLDGVRAESLPKQKA